jgi:hypothetical protein
MKSRMRQVVVLTALVGCALSRAASAQVQQLADSNYVPAVTTPAFTKHHPKILFDEAHHNFHTLEGRYQAFGTLMKADGCELTSNREPLSTKTLEGFDVLVIANALVETPDSEPDSTADPSAFEVEEIEAVHRWVSEGGALLLIADHAPFGSAAAALSARFGVDMSMGYTGDSLQSAGSGGITNIEFTRARGTLGDHPIMDGWSEQERVNRIVAFTGQSLRGPVGSTPLMKLTDAAVDIPPAALKAAGGPAAVMANAIPAKGRSMAVALQVGHGRAVVQGEAGMLSAQIVIIPGQEPYKFGMNQPGLDNQQYALNVMRWLAQSKR